MEIPAHLTRRRRGAAGYRTCSGIQRARVGAPKDADRLSERL